jgi:negative regulator of sigma E activity
MRCWLSAAIERVCSHGAEVQRQREPCEGHASCVCLYIVFGVVSWTGGIQVSMGLDDALFSCVSLASGAGDVRLCRRAPGTGIPARAATGGSRVASSVDTMLHSMRRRCDGS